MANDNKVFLSGWQKIYVISLSLQDVTAASVESEKASGGESRSGYVKKILSPLHSSGQFLKCQKKKSKNKS